MLQQGNVAAVLECRSPLQRHVRRGDRQHVARRDALCLQSRPLTVADADRRIESALRQILQCQRRIDIQRNIGAGFMEGRQAR